MTCSEQKRKEIEAREAQRKLAHVSRVSTMGDFAASLAHQINQPLAGILTNAQAARCLLNQPTTSAGEVDAAIADIVEDTRRAGDIIERVREMMTRGSEAPGLVAHDEPPGWRKAPDLDTGTVFLVDDDLSVRRAITRLLEANGVTTVATRSVAEFLALEAIRRPMCIVADIQMPEQSGFELIETIRRDGHTWPVILVTGYADTGIHRRSRQTGAVALLVKPVDERELLDAVAEGLRRDRFGSDLRERQRGRTGSAG